MKWVVALLWLWAMPAAAQVVTIKSGEHGPFTRLVLTFPAMPEWTLGRTANGYGLDVGDASYRYDLSDVYRLIKPDRLKTIWVDPETGRLEFGVECECHAIPFEFTSRILVVDLHDGQAPAGSSFELALSGKDERPIAPGPATQGASYDWIETSPPAPPDEPAPPPAEPAEKQADLAGPLQDAINQAGFRQQLIEEIGRGATAGQVDLVIPPPEKGAVHLDHDLQVRTSLGELPGMHLSKESAEPESLTDRGAECPPDANFDIRIWVSDGEPATIMAEAKTGLVSEFDVPNEERIKQAAKTYIYFGFGAEARNLLRAFRTNIEEKGALIALSYLVERNQPPENHFLGMQSCDSAVALWSVVAANARDPLIGLNGNAVARSFMGLPLHLKRATGEQLIDRLLRQGDQATAQIIRAEMKRATPSGDPEFTLLEAELSLNDQQAAAAEVRIDSIPAEVLSAKQLVAKVEARFQQGMKVPPEDVTALQAFAFEYGEGPEKPAFLGALAHASALSHRYAEAFGYAGDDRALKNDVWKTIAEQGPTAQILNHSVAATSQDIALVPPEVREMMARKLLQLGLPKVAANWHLSAEANPILAAEISLADHDARSALQHLAESPTQSDPALRAKVYAELGAYESAARMLDQAGLAGAAAQQRRRLGQMSGSVQAQTWEDVATAAAATSGATEMTPLERSRAYLANATATQQAIAALLAETAAPRE